MRFESRRLNYEALEHRELLAITVVERDIVIVGTSLADVATVTESGENLQVSLGTHVQSYAKSAIDRVVFFGRAGDDTFSNETSVPSIAVGGAGNDTLTGGSAEDRLFGDSAYFATQPLTLSHLNVVRNNFGRVTGAFDSKGDFNHDGVTDLRDLNLVRNNFGKIPADQQPVGGNDFLYGGAGNDLLFGERGSDSLFGEDDADDLYGGDDADRVFGGDGDDYLYGENGQDDLFGELGDDDLVGGSDADDLDGGVGSDVITGEVDASSIWNSSDHITSDSFDILVGATNYQAFGLPGLDNTGLGLVGSPFGNVKFEFEFLGVVDEGTKDWSATEKGVLKSMAENDWGPLLPASFNNETITVAVIWDVLDDTTNAETVPQFDQINNTIYTRALANHLDKVDRSSGFDFTITFNSAGRSWFLQSGAIQDNQTDFAGVARHEIGHGLGFTYEQLNPRIASRTEQRTEGYGGLFGKETVNRRTSQSWDAYLYKLEDRGTVGKAWINMTAAEREIAKEGDNLFWTGDANQLLGSRIKIYSSPNERVSHIDEDKYGGLLMTPKSKDGVLRDKVHSLELAMLQDLGWTVNFDELAADTSRGRLHSVDTLVNSVEILDVRQDPEWTTSTSMTSLNGWIYVVDGGSLWKVNPADGAFVRVGAAGDWVGPSLMTAYDDRLYILQAKTLWRVNPAGGSGYYARVGSSGDWSNAATSMTTFDNRLYIIEGETLWRVNPAGGSGYYARVGDAGDWVGSTLMTAYDNRLYIVEGDTLWRVNPAGGSGYYARVGDAGDWARDPKAITTLGDRLYIIENNSLWRVDPTGFDPPGSRNYYVRVGRPGDWPYDSLLTGIGINLFGIRDVAG